MKKGTPPRVLMVVFEFPPSNGASVQRILSVYRGFLDAGFVVDVLTAKPYAYSNTQPLDPSLLPSNPHGTICRTLALDVMRHLAIRGKYLGSLIRPDRWGFTWQPSALRAGKNLIKKNPPDLIWSSAPTPSPHVIAYKLSKQCHAKWIADYRDPMPYMHRQPGTETPLDKMHQQIDQQVMETADILTFATQQICDTYQEYAAKHLKISPQNYQVMENGFDSHLLAQTENKLREKNRISSPFSRDKISLYYAGQLYPDGRDPRPIFAAMAKLKTLFVEPALELVFQGAGTGDEFKEELQALGLLADVRFMPAVPFTESLQNMLMADVLVLIQDARFNRQIPGKLYEYLATNRPVILKTPKESATATLASKYVGVFLGEEEISLSRALYDTIAYLRTDAASAAPRDVSSHARETHVSRMIHSAKTLLELPPEDARSESNDARSTV